MDLDLSARRSRCPMNHAIEILGDQWTLLVVRDMVFHHRRSFSELAAMPEAIATNLLADRLRRLEEAGIVTKDPDPDDGRRRIYTLTQHGRGLIPMLLEMMVWSRDHTADVDVTRTVTKKIKDDPEAARQEIERRLDEAEEERSA